MIIIDYNQVSIASITMQLKLGKNKIMDEGLCRHMILNSLRYYRNKFKKKYGELVIAGDATDYWRKKKFPYYKQHRKGDQQTSSIDWNELFRILNLIREELKDNFPYPVIRVDRAEADDIIGALCQTYGKDLGGTPILIISGDHDFKQLQRFSNVEQWTPTGKKFIKHNNPLSYIKEHIMRGDKGDGVPNFLSPDDTFVTKKDQNPLGDKKIKALVSLTPTEIWSADLLKDYDRDTLKKNWKRNEVLVDLRFVPENIKVETVRQFKDQQDKGRSKIFNFFIKKKLRNLMSQIQEF